MSKVAVGVVGGVIALGVVVFFLAREDKAAPASTVISESRPVQSTNADPPPANIEIEAPPQPAPMPRSELASTNPPSPQLPKQVIDFSQRADPDPVLSRELEYVIQKSIDAQPSTNGYEVQSVKCRGADCLIFTVDRVPTQEDKWTSAFSKVLGNLSHAAIRHPGTGVQLQPSLEQFAQKRDGGALTLLRFKSQ